ncbi:MAG: putative transrane protein [Polaromonas sp.]|nr:putative transrane protein [Polaromonas sp.]
MQAVEAGTALPNALNHAPAAPVRFVPQGTLPPGQAYEHYLFHSGQCPTRDNLHDFFNGLCWLRFPRTKRRLNQLQAAEIQKSGIQPLRGPVRDALTVFDENAAFLLAPQPLWDALLARDWQRLFIGLRPLWQEAQLVLFGHALLEKLVYPRKPITAHVYHAQPAINSIAELDGWIAEDLSAEKLAGKPFAPLPVLGVPGWWPDNEDFSFYDDATVFRPRR